MHAEMMERHSKSFKDGNKWMTSSKELYYVFQEDTWIHQTAEDQEERGF